MMGEPEAPLPDRPPKWARRLLERAVPRGVVGRTMVGDLEEEYHRRPVGAGRRAWYTAAAVGLAVQCVGWRMVDRAGGAAGHAGRLDDLRTAVRGLRSSPGHTAVVVLVLGIGIGASTAILSVAWGSILQPLPYPEQERLLFVGDRQVGRPADRISGNISLPNLRDVAAASRTLRAVSPYRDVRVVLSGAGSSATRVGAQEITPGYFGLLGSGLRLGRGFVATDRSDSGGGAVILSERLWRQSFGADPGIVGRTVAVDGVPRTVIGVAAHTALLGEPLLWIPLPAASERLEDRRAGQVYGLARLADGVELAVARRELDAIFDRLRERYPEENAERGVAAVSLGDVLVGRRAPRLVVLLAGAALLVLLVAVVNVANLLLVRTERRRRSLAIRAAVGASRVRLVRELLAESLLLSVGGAVVGVALSEGGVRLLVALYGSVLPRAREIELSGPVLLGALALAGISGLLVTVIPALRLPHRSPRSELSVGARSSVGSARVQHALVVAETALAVTLAAGAGLLLNSSVRLASVDFGAEEQDALVFSVSLPDATHPDPPSRRAFFDTFTGELRGLPGVAAVGASTRTPLQGGGNTSFTLPDRAEQPTDALEIRDVLPGLFRTLGVELLSGRPLDGRDITGDPSVVVNRAFEEAYFPTGGALNARLVPGGQDRTFRVVGVVEDIREFGPEAPPRPTAYWAWGNGPYGAFPALSFVVRTTTRDPLDLVPVVRERLRSIDPTIPMDSPQRLSTIANLMRGSERRAVASLLSVAAGLALLLGAAGLYPVLSYAVTRRTREMGIRRALGAGGAEVRGMIMGRALRLVLPGMALGLVVALAGGQILASFLYGIRPGDPPTLAAVSGVLLLTAFLASWLPARRAARVSPLRALDVE